MGCGWDGGMMEWVSSIKAIIRDCGLCVTLSKEKTLAADGRQVSVDPPSKKKKAGALSQE